MSRHSPENIKKFEQAMQPLMKDVEGIVTRGHMLAFYNGVEEWSVIKTKTTDPQNQGSSIDTFKLNIKYKGIPDRLIKELSQYYQSVVVDFLYKCPEGNIIVEAAFVNLPGIRDKRFPDLAGGTRAWDVVIYPFSSQARANLILDTIHEIVNKRFKGK